MPMLSSGVMSIYVSGPKGGLAEARATLWKGRHDQDPVREKSGEGHKIIGRRSWALTG